MIPGIVSAQRQGFAGYSDPHWTSVVSLLHFDGANGAKIYTDEKGKTWNKLGTGIAELRTAQAKFGPSSLYLSGGGTTAGIREAVSSNVFFSSSFTLELFFRLDSVTGTDQVTLSNASATSGYDWNIVATAAGLAARAGTGGTYSIPAGGTVIAGTWHHAALVRNGNVMSLYLDGGLVGSIAYTISPSSGGFISVGHASNGGLKAYGYFDDLRVTKDIARYTANFTPPSSPYPNS